MTRFVRATVGKLFVAALLTLGIGLQVLEASGRWDRALQDTNDEAVIVALVLCIGAALVAAAGLLAQVRPSGVSSRIVLGPTRSMSLPATRFALSTSCAGPPVSPRI